MAQQRIDVVQSFPFSVDKLYAFLSDHEKLVAIFPAKIKRVRDGQNGVNGVGSVRRLTVAPGVSLEETVTKAEANQRIEYTITKGGWPVVNHQGVMQFSTDGTGSRLHYVITFDSALPGTGWLVRQALQTPIVAGLKKLAKRGL